MELNKIYFIIFRFFYELLRIYQFSKKSTKIYDIFYLLHGSTYVELNKICFVIFRFFYKLLHIYQFSTDPFYAKKHRQASSAKKYIKLVIFFIYSTDLHMWS